MSNCPRLLVVLFFAIQAVTLGAADVDDFDDETSPRPPDQTRLDWQRRTLVTDYEKVGQHSDAWDATVQELLEIWAIVRATPGGTNAERIRKVSAGLIKAVAAGCDDPLVAYLHVRLAPPSEGRTPGQLAEVSAAAARNLSRSQYSEWLKFYGHLRAAEALVQAHAVTKDTNEAARLWGSVGRHRRAAIGYLVAVVRQAEAPMEELYVSVNELLEHLGRNPLLLEGFCKALEPELLKQDSKDSLVWLLRSDFYTSYAWAARTTAAAVDVPKSAWPIFEERLKKADEAIRRAWQLNMSDPRIPLSGIHVELGLADDRAKMEQWFDRTMKLNSNSVAACKAKMYYLEPKWHGSPEAMLAFGRECVNSRKWGGQVPLMLVDAHQRLASYLPESERTNYWHQPAVWRDIKRSYDAYFVRNPTRQARNGQFARYAFWCEQWDVFLAHIELLSKDYRERYFGGAKEFNRMVQLAKARSTKRQ